MGEYDGEGGVEIPKRWPPKKTRAGWDKSTRKTHDPLDIDKYLAEDAEISMITQRIIYNFIKHHKNRIYDPKKRGYVSRFIEYSHGAYPFCKICNEDFYTGDDIYVFMLSRGLYPKFYHVECFNNTKESRKRNIIYQDRAFRKRIPDLTIEEIIEEDEREPTEFEKFEKAMKKSGIW